MRRQKGITLIALIITVIVLLILAGVTINMVLGERGIFNKAVTVAEESKIAQYKEQIELARGTVALENNGTVTIDKLAEQIVKEKIVDQDGIEMLENVIKVTTKEGYVFYVKADGTEYAGTKNELTPPGSMDDYIEKRQIKISVEKAGQWANKKRVTVTSELGYYKIQYSMDGGDSWIDYKGPIEITENKTIYVTLVNKKGEQGEAAQYIIDKIDTTPPQITNVIGTLGKITFSASDTESGISGYKITKDTNTPTSFEAIGEIQNTITDKEVTVEEQGVYYVWVQDQAGNISAYSSAITEIIPVTGITVAPDTLKLSVGGEPVKLTASIQPSNATYKNITWTSSNASVATVDNDGNVTPIGEGTCDITATTEDGNFTATCSIDVKNLVTKITLNKEQFTLKPGATYKLTATVEPDNATNKEITWSSGNAGIATVASDGTITGGIVGETKIRVTAQDGSGVYAECSITVESPSTKVTNYPIDANGDGSYENDWDVLLYEDDYVYLIYSGIDLKYDNSKFRHRY